MKIVACLLLLLAGCATRAPVSGFDDAVARNPLICENAQECSDMWQRAQLFVANNSGMKIQLATDTIIETYNAPDYSSRWVFKLRKEPLGSGRSRIWIDAGCGGPLCKEDKMTVIARAKTYIGAVK